jgi:hypothetical protein
MMDDKTVQRKLNQLTKISNELVAETKRRFGDDGNVFYEAEGAFHFMDGDEFNGTGPERQAHIVMSSSKRCLIDCGGW